MFDLRTLTVSAWIGLFFTALFLFCAIFAPWIAPYGKAEIVGGVWEPMSEQFLLGTDNLGRDLLSRMIHGARTTVFIASVATARFRSARPSHGRRGGGWFDTLMSRLSTCLCRSRR